MECLKQTVLGILVATLGVGHAMAVEEAEYTVMPVSYSLESLPEPNDPKASLRHVSAQRIAAIRYSGFWSEKRYQRNKDKLDAWIKENGFQVIGPPIWARYDPPFMPWFLRRNEVLVPIAMPQDGE